jgi:hypothetical protein
VIDFIPLESYTRVYYLILAAFVSSLSIMLLNHPKAVIATPGIRNDVVRIWGWACVAIMIVVLGLRPISFAFGDMGNYYKQFQAYQAGAELGQRDLLFEGGLWLYARYLTAPLFFLSCLLLYLVPLIAAFRRLLGAYWPLAFFLAVAHFDFYGYGVNGIRQGIASSLFLLALTTRGLSSWLLMACSVGVHGSLIVPFLGYLLTLCLKRPGYYFTGWLICLAATSIYAGFGELIFSTGFGGERLDKYSSVDSEFLDQLSKVGYRFDFLIYSLPPILLGYYLVVVRGVRDYPYLRMLQIYLTSNAVWLLMIRSPISNRIAYLSWFLMGVLIAYPLVRHRLFKGQHFVYVGVLIAMFGYTFFSKI